MLPGGRPLPDIHGVLPHRYPFLLVDRITALEPGRWAEGVKRVSEAEWCVDSAGPRTGMPGGLIVEALAQLSAAVLLGLVGAGSGAVGYFLGLDRVRYRGTAQAGDELLLRVELVRARRGLCRTRGEAWVTGGGRVVRAELTIVLRTEPATVAPVT
jgi:3-hydroxyacyl-[acyl-carrier-protein] dehydratase